MTNWWEGLAVLLAIIYLVLAIRQHAACWPAAIASAGIFLFVLADAGLYMEAALQVFYIAIALYGWRLWLVGESEQQPLFVTRWRVRQHIAALSTIAVLTAASGELLSRFSDAALPYLDAFTTWGAVITTWMVARKVLDNWIYWFVIDGVSIYLFISRDLYLTAGLFGIYLILVVIGFLSWRRSMRDAMKPMANSQPPAHA